MQASVLKIRIYGDSCLRKKSIPVEVVGFSERMLIASMIATMYHSKGIGLAAPQVGVNRRIIVVDVGDGPVVCINPRITKRSGLDALEEGCLSIPGVLIVVNRPQRIVVQYTDEQNKKRELVCNDLLARAIQHETDHLKGRLIVDYANRKEKAKFSDQLKLLEKENKN